jgi:hypothetical protein
MYALCKAADWSSSGRHCNRRWKKHNLSVVSVGTGSWINYDDRLNLVGEGKEKEDSKTTTRQRREWLSNEVSKTKAAKDECAATPPSNRPPRRGL